MVISAKQVIFRQGDTAKTLFFIRSGKVSLTVLSPVGKEAVLGILNAGAFFGEGSLIGQLRRKQSATALTACDLLRIDKKAMALALHVEGSLSEMFIAYLLARNIEYEARLADQLFNFSEKRLARVLLVLAKFGEGQDSNRLIRRVSQETLAEMVGTTRPRINSFMNRFRKLGFIDYDDREMQIHWSLVNVVLHD